MPTNIAEAVRAEYEQRPYPAVTKERLRRPPWRPPPIEWINTVAPSAGGRPERILVAGCGTGFEAFAYQRRYPKAEITAIDFAAHSIRIAQGLQKNFPSSRKIQFVRADLTSSRLSRIVGKDFDFISCHGVMSYIPAPASALSNLARCLAPDGVLYLGVNGQAHFSETWRQFLPAFGFDMTRWAGGRRVRQHLAFTAALAGEECAGILKLGDSYLASDLFGPVIHNLALAKWLRICREAGLHLRGSEGSRQLLSPVVNGGSYEVLLPRSRAEVAEVLELLKPRAFHSLILSLQPEALPPWGKVTALMNWRPLATEHFRKFRLPAGNNPTAFRLENKKANISLELRGAGWEIALLRGSNGERSLREILAPLPPVAPSALRSQLYLFYLLDLLNLLPPTPRHSDRRSPDPRAARRSP